MKYLIEQASPGDREAILTVMRAYNMHHIPSSEMEELDLDNFYIAKVGSQIVGAAGYKVLSQTTGKTTLMAVLPDYGGQGLGLALQRARLRAMADVGVKRVITNADVPATIAWYKKHFGYVEVGKLKKTCEFGLLNVSHWTTLELDLEAWLRKEDAEKLKQQQLEHDEPPPLAPYKPLLINVALTGMVPRKEDNASLPVSPAEIIEQALEVANLGAQIVHLHARDETGAPTWKAAVYEEILLGIRREQPKLVCCVSASGRNWQELEKRAEVLSLAGDARPDMASLTLGSLNFPSGASLNSPEVIEALLGKMQEAGIVPELEAFDLGMVAYSRHLDRRGLLPRYKYFNLLLGNLGTAPATPAALAGMIEALPERSLWSVAGIGRFQLPMSSIAIAAGGGVRVGLEDNLLYDWSAKTPATNAQLVKRALRIAEELQRPLATLEETRKLLGLPSRSQT